MAKGRRRASGLFTNIFLAALILTLYYAVQPGSGMEAVPVAAPVYRGSGDGAALQFSVCWNAAALSDIMDILADNGVAATFAVSGEWAEDNPALLLRMASEGHEIATLGYSQGQDGRLSWLLEDLERSVSTIEGLCGVKPRLYYSGNRAVAPSSMAAQKLGLTQVDCTIDLLCAKGEAEDIVSRIPEEPIGGSIILLQPTAECAEALEGILAALAEKGLRATCTGKVLA